MKFLAAEDELVRVQRMVPVLDWNFIAGHSTGIDALLANLRATRWENLLDLELRAESPVRWRRALMINGGMTESVGPSVNLGRGCLNDQTTDIPLMSNIFIAAAATALVLVSAGTHAQGIAPGGPIGGSTGIGSGLGGVVGTGPSWPDGTNQAPRPSISSVPPGGYGHSAPSFSPPSAMQPSPYPQPGEPFTD